MLCYKQVINATKVGGVDGIFADHNNAMLKPMDEAPSGLPALCNGAGSIDTTTGFGRRCWEFTPDFAESFNLGHQWIVNHTQVIMMNRVLKTRNCVSKTRNFLISNDESRTFSRRLADRMGSTTRMYYVI